MRNHRSNSIRWTFHPASGFERVAPQWQALCNASAGNALLSSDFMQIALRHFGRGDELICLAENAAGPAAATMLRHRHLLYWKVFQPSQMPLGPWLQVAGLDTTAAARSLLRAIPGPAAMLGVTGLDPQLCPRPQGPWANALDWFSTGTIELPPDESSYFASLDSKPLAGLCRRMRKAAKEIGVVQLTLQTKPAQVNGFISQYAAIESRSWKRDSGTALMPDDQQSSFYSDLLGRFAERGQARMYTLAFGERVAAAQIALAGTDTLYLLKTSFDSDLSSLGPGVMMHGCITRHVYEHDAPLKRIELYGRLNQSQMMWVTHTRTLFHANFYATPMLAMAHRALKALHAPNARSRPASQADSALRRDTPD